MLQDRFRKKIIRPTGGGNSSSEITDITDQVPQIDDVLAEVDSAVNAATDLEQQFRLDALSRSSRICGC